MSQPNQICVGIDVAKGTLDVCIGAGNTSFTVVNGTDGFEQIINALKDVDWPHESPDSWYHLS